MYIEKIKFERTGGFAGIRLVAEIEMDVLPDDQKRQIIELIDEADFDDLAEKLSKEKPIPVPDAFNYSITVKSREKEHQVFLNEASLPDDLQPLIEILERNAKRQMRK